MQRNQWLIDIWDKEYARAEEIDNVPAMLYYSYGQLIDLVKNGQVYGVLLQIKDVFEQLYKIPLVMMLIVLDNESKYKDEKEYSDIIKSAIGSPMSMGQWDALASTIIKSSRSIDFPEVLITILKRTRTLYRTDISPTAPDIINWRNNTIGHGVLKFEDDLSYREEIEKLLEMLRNYFNGTKKYSINNLYDSAYFTQGGYKLTGSNLYSYDNSGVLKLHLDNREYECSHYINNHELKYYLFDSYYCKKKVIKYCSYYDGQNEIVQSKYFSDLYEKFILKRRTSINGFSDIISREDDILLEYLNTPSEYVKPLELIQCLEDKLEEMISGVITIFMERGTGKSAFANQMSGLYHNNPLIKSSFSRCYHISNASIRGTTDFINSINFSFRHSFDPSQDLWGGIDDIPTLSTKTSTPSMDMANFLNYFHDKYRKEYTILVIDGIDEITDENESIIDYIPEIKHLADGVFVILLSRFKDEKTVTGNSKKTIEKVESLTNGSIAVRRESQMNINVLRRSLERENKRETKARDIDIDELIIKADYRYLYLKAFVDIKDELILDTSSEKSFIHCYLDYILSYYGPVQRRRLKEIAVAIALLPGITIKQYQEYLNYMELSYEFIGMFNDIMPLLTVVHNNGESSYEYADSAFAEYVLKEFDDEINTVLKSFDVSLDNHLHDYITGTNRIPSYNRYMHGEVDKQLAEKLGNDIIFFAEGYIGIYNCSLNNNKLINYTSNSINIARLCNAMRGDDPWVRRGYPYYLYSKLLDCISSRLEYSLRNSNIPELISWRKDINSRLTSWGTEHSDLLCGLAQDLIHNKKIDKIYENIICNLYPLESITEWFWIFERKIREETVRYLIAKNCFEDFLYYLHQTGLFYVNSEWSDLLLNYVKRNNVSSEAEEIVLNMAIRKYVERFYQYPFQQYVDTERDARYAISIIKKKQYSINNIICENKVNERTLNMITDRNLFLYEFERERKRVLSILLDFQEQWKAGEDGFGQLLQVFYILELPLREYIREDAISELYDAIYERLCFERDFGNLYSFVCSENGLGECFIDILTKRYSDETQVYFELKQWMSIIWKKALSGDHNLKNQGLDFISRVVASTIKWLDSKNKNSESLEILEFYIKHIDSALYFREFPLYLGSYYYDERWKLIDWSEKVCVFCTDNTLYLLKRYYDNNMLQKMGSLIEMIDNSIYTVYSSSFFNAEGRWEGEYDKLVQIFKYISFRFMIDYHNQFDEYMENILEEFEKEIAIIVDEINDNADFGRIGRIEFNINCLMECIWRTSQWSKGEKICNRLLLTVVPKEPGINRKIDAVIYQVRMLIRAYKAFIRFLIGEKYDAIFLKDFYYAPEAPVESKSDSMISAMMQYSDTKEEQGPEEYIKGNQYIFSTNSFIEEFCFIYPCILQKYLPL